MDIALQYEFLGRSTVGKQVCIEFKILEIVERAHHQHHEKGRHHPSERGAIEHHLGACRVKGIEHLLGSAFAPASRFGRDKGRRIQDLNHDIDAEIQGHHVGDVNKHGEHFLGINPGTLQKIFGGVLVS